MCPFETIVDGVRRGQPRMRQVMAMAGVRLPLESYPLQALFGQVYRNLRPAIELGG